jgi:inner membrane protein
MDSITHTLMGLTIYASTNKEQMTKPMRNSILLTTLLGSHLPDSDVISQLWDTNGMYQMWHRGITHSLFAIPVWALLLSVLCYLFWRVRDLKIFYIGLFTVFVHILFDSMNTWGTGLLEPFSSVRVSFGAIPIIDFAIWAVMLSGLLVFFMKKLPMHLVFKGVSCIIALHVLIQSAQAYVIHQSTKDHYDQSVVSAGFVPWHFKVIGKKGDIVEILEAKVWGQPNLIQTLQSDEKADLQWLFERNSRARTLYEWSPFVVVVNDENVLGIYDPRFYRNGESFLYEYAEKK